MQQSCKKLRFVINPISGSRSKLQLEEVIERIFKDANFEYDIVYTKASGHATELAQEAAKDGCDVVVAVGGDGTINEIGKGLVHSDTALGIIPMGSGNGLARHLGIPLNTEEAIKNLLQAQFSTMDVGKANDTYFFCTAGIGFDADVAHLFSKQKKRGIASYFKSCVQLFRKYKPRHYQYKIGADETSMFNAQEAYMIVFGNAGQYGANAWISPRSDVSDGLLEMNILKPFPKWKIFGVIHYLRAKKIDQYPTMECWAHDDFILKLDAKYPAHLDGEPIFWEGEVNVKLLPSVLRMYF